MVNITVVDLLNSVGTEGLHAGSTGHRDNGNKTGLPAFEQAAEIHLRVQHEALALELWEYDVLSALRRQGAPYVLPATRLARETDLSSGAMTNRIDRLEERGLVRRRQARNDRRGVNVSLTAKGRRLIDKAIQHRLESARDSLAALDPGQQHELAQLLRTVVLAGTDPD